MRNDSMSRRKLIPIEDILSYDPDTGVILWKRGRRAGDHAGVEQSNGNIEIRMYGSSYRAHHIAWYLGHGEWPVNHIRRINGCKGDLRLDNLDLIPGTLMPVWPPTVKVY
jgi:hypothetical protein